jgi:DNA-binding FadR family transcriptional regulator
MSEILTGRKELSTEVAKRLREMIVMQNMKAGDRLPNETELGRMFGISRSTVREAIKLLLADNVVEIQRGKGTFVTLQPGVGKDPLGLEFTNRSKLLDNLMETRMMIEPQIAALAAQRADQQNLDKLAHIIQQICEAGSDKGNHTPFDVAFHTAVAECTKNDVLYRILPIICESIQEGYLKTANVPGSYERAIQSHINIYHAIANRDSETAKLETEKHIRQTQKDMIVIGGNV